jgi:hypothetical protein
MGFTESTFTNGINSQFFGAGFSDWVVVPGLLQEMLATNNKERSKRMAIMLAD